MDRGWVAKFGTEPVKDLLLDYSEKVDSGYSVEYYFVSTGKASERVKGLADSCNESLAEREAPVRCFLLDFEALKDYFVRARSLEDSLPEAVTLQFQERMTIEVAEPYPTIVGVIKGNSLRDLYKTHREALFAWNIRSYLGERGINKNITRTANEHPQDFFYFNNGVTAICTDFQLRTANSVSVTKLQIVNGAQTVGGLSRSKPNPSLYVLFRLTKTKSVSTEKGVNADIIRYNNTQNIIKVSDFRSNDKIQLWLEHKFAEYKWHESYPDVASVSYARKRGATLSRLPGARSVGFEDLAKIRYAFNHEPTLILSAPKDLWTRQEDDENGKYEISFGVDGHLLDTWTDEEFAKCIQAVAFYLRIADEIRREVKEDQTMRFLHRLRFHAVALAGDYARTLESAGRPLPKAERGIGSVWEHYWGEARRVLIDGYEDAVASKESTFYAFTRSGDRWERLKSKFARHVRPSKVAARK